MFIRKAHSAKGRDLRQRDLFFCEGSAGLVVSYNGGTPHALFLNGQFQYQLISLSGLHDVRVAIVERDVEIAVKCGGAARVAVVMPGTVCIGETELAINCRRATERNDFKPAAVRLQSLISEGYEDTLLLHHLIAPVLYYRRTPISETHPADSEWIELAQVESAA